LNADDIKANFVQYGTRLISLLVPDRSRRVQDVVVGYDNGSIRPTLEQ